MVNVAEKKFHLIQLVSAIDNPADLDWLERQLEKRQPGKNGKPAKAAAKKTKQEALYEKLKERAMKKPYREKFDPEETKREQGWKGQHDKEEMMRLIREMDIQEPVEELLAMLTP
ncbi:MAG: hypothetical protein AAB316_07895 [Bacteroidota bacterium]